MIVLFAYGSQTHMQFGTMTLPHMETHHHALYVHRGDQSWEVHFFWPFL